MANTVIGGRWQGSTLEVGKNRSILLDGRDVTKEVVGYEIATEEHKIGSGIGGAVAGTILLGPVGLAGGLLAARKRRTSVLTWKNGERSLVEIRSGDLHKLLTVTAAFNGEQPLSSCEPSFASSERAMPMLLV